MTTSTLKKMLYTGLVGAAIPAAHAADGTFLIQMKDYKGENAYYTLYVVDPDGRYVRTLWVSGPEFQFHRSQPRWWKYLGRKPQKVDAITGASLAAGDRNVLHVHLDPKEVQGGYKVRLDTSVEQQNNYPTDVETSLDPKAQGKKVPGTGYVRYLRYKWDN